MTATVIRQLFEAALVAVNSAIPIAYENFNYTPVNGVAYQRVNLLLSNPTNPEIGAQATGGFYVESGIFQVTLRWPYNTGPAALMVQAEAIRAAFYQGRTLTATKNTIIIAATPTIAPGMIDGDRWSVPVKVRFTANCFS